MVKRAFIDFESRSQCDIWASGAWVYSAHPTTEVLCLAHAVDNDQVYCANFYASSYRSLKQNYDESLAYSVPDLSKTSDVEQLKAYFKALVEEGAEFHAHNAFFERSMWANILVPKYGFTPIPLRQWRCTAAKASAHALPKALEKAAEAMDLKHKKDMAGSSVMKRLAKSTGRIDAGDMARLMLYCRQDVEVERELDSRLPDLDAREQRVWFLDQYINDTGVQVDIEACKKAVEVLDIETERLTKELQTLSGGEINAGTQREAVKKFLEKKGVKLPNLQKKTVKEALANTDGLTNRVLFLRQQLSLTSNAKYKSFLDCTSADGRVRDILVYHGASTGRWSGKLVQLQNLVKPEEQDFDNQGPIGVLCAGGYDSFSMFYGNAVLNTLSACIRGMLIPSSGHEMFVTDFAAIEARVVMWLADEQNGLSIFHRQDSGDPDADIYVHMARQIFNDRSITKKNKDKRQVGKQAVLGCGYGLGPAKFYDTCQKYGIDIGPADTEYETWGEKVMIPKLAKDAVWGYRNTFAKVPMLWTNMEEAAKSAVRGRPVQCGKTVWYMDGEFLRVKLPTGRTLAYHRPRVTDDKLTYMAADPITKRYIVEETYGGKLVEQCSQAVARDLMVESMFHFATTGFRILFTVHDELVLEAPNGSKSEADVLKIVRTVPTWAQGCPVNAECEKVTRYKK